LGGQGESFVSVNPLVHRSKQADPMYLGELIQDRMDSVSMSEPSECAGAGFVP